MSTTDYEPLWATLLQLHAAIAARYQGDVRQAVAAAGLEGQPLELLLQALYRDPLPLTAEILHHCAPYYAPAAFAGYLLALAQGGWLTPAETRAGYCLTDEARDALEEVNNAVQRRLSALEPMPQMKLQRLAYVLDVLARTCLSDLEVTDDACVEASGANRPNTAPSPLPRIARSIETLVNYRCDAHRAVWAAYAVSGPAWEALTLLWRGEADSAAALAAWSEAQGLPRGYGAEAYADVLQELAAHGWVSGAPGGRYTLTDAGRRVRETAEAATNAKFFGPWDDFDVDDMADVQDLAPALLRALQSGHGRA